MKRLQTKRHLSNDGFSLMELIITVLISSIVTTAAVAFLSVGMRYYWNAGDETTLQTESQIAELFLTELFQEATDFHKLDATYPADMTYAFEVVREKSGTDCYAVVALKGTEIWYKELTTEESTKTDAEKVAIIAGATKDTAFLAGNATELTLSETCWADAMSSGGVVTGTEGLVKLDMTFHVNGREYKESTWISLRNTKRN